MFQEYVNKMLLKAEYKILEDGNWFASIDGCQGVWASCPTVEATRSELIEVLEEWLVLKLKSHDKIPFFEEINNNRIIEEVSELV